MVHKTLHIKLNIEQQEHHWSVTSGSPEGRVVANHCVAVLTSIDKSCVK
jgi:hypothetical protein